MEKLSIGIVGAGNLGCVLATKFSLSNDVILFTEDENKVNTFNKKMKVHYEDNDTYYEANIKEITSDLQGFCSKCDYIFITFPAFLFEKFSKNIIPSLNSNHHLVFVPGSGGAELFFKEALNKGATISGLQRVHAIARVEKPGEIVKESGIKKSLKVATLPNSKNGEICKILSELFKMKIEELNNYLNVTFVNSNPTLHTSRLYNLFSDFNINTKEYDYIPLFYEDWNEETSKLLIELDEEIFEMIKLLNSKGLNINQLLKITEHYDSYDAISMTKKIKSIDAFKGLKTPCIENENHKFVPDFNSRYFVSDFNFGLDILLAFAEILNTRHEKMSQVSSRYHNLVNKKREFKLEKFNLNSLDDILNLYSN